MTGQSLYYSGTDMCFKSNIERADAQRDMIDSNTEKKKVWDSNPAHSERMP